ncbi:hypothetical protein JKA74_17450 [Marivirga sp. S37H4]|uniref:Uncharacterized protein n=1 Tax=Marivirga aurantiaca TaxID=2802615 RepID=A0A935CDE5_9BACT|nr:hypothetical protein [Marivirga aurantiaca]MBK6266833.1 hypothetical protein [Marivirga aurantiaca]
MRFQSKEESNKQQREAFLKLAPIDRFYAFLELSEWMKDFPTKFEKDKNRNKNNFEVIIHRNE